ncbi:MAG: hypothetical protein KDI09_09390 [Halioglobus sp.]|nr:hypothetical protein [Halioglobus sp.]
MSTDHPSAQKTDGKPSLMQRVGNYMQDPLGSIVTASAATIGSFGFVLSGIWFVNLAVN